MTTVLHWFRRDLRVSDNTSLSAAARDADRVVPVFILDDHYANDPERRPGAVSVSAREPGGAGGEAPVRRAAACSCAAGRPPRRCRRCSQETGAEAVYANHEIGPYPEQARPRSAGGRRTIGARLRLFPDALLVEPDAIATAAGDPFTVYTPFSKTVDGRREARARARSGAPRDSGAARCRLSKGSVRGEISRPDPAAPAGGESKALALLHRFLDGAVRDYADGRNFPARLSTSRLSPHLHFGTISPRTVRRAAVEAWKAASPTQRESVNRYVRELAWREFFHHVLFHFPQVADGNFKKEFDRLPWQSNPAGLAAWKAGRTGFPLVDAAMRELSTTHWMHNRARMVAASFLTKDLHIDWREGEKWFEHELADADLANNNGGWQWAAGTGTDAAPYFRIFHPVLQSRRFDPDGAYIRRFVPELARVPAEKIHEPWTMTAGEQREAVCRIGREYPSPLLDHAREREVALRMYGAAGKG